MAFDYRLFKKQALLGIRAFDNNANLITEDYAYDKIVDYYEINDIKILSDIGVPSNNKKTIKTFINKMHDNYVVINHKHQIKIDNNIYKIDKITLEEDGVFLIYSLDLTMVRSKTKGG